MGWQVSPKLCTLVKTLTLKFLMGYRACVCCYMQALVYVGGESIGFGVF